MTEKVTGMVLAATPIGEYDKRLVILTKERGKIAAFSKGARRPNSLLLACSQPFTFGEFYVYVGRNSYTLSSANVQNYFENIREDLEDICYGNYFCEVASYFTKENMECTKILQLLYLSLRALKVPSLPSALVRYIFEMKMLQLDGQAPRLFECMNCGKTEHLCGFVSHDAGILCKECNRGSSILLSETTVYTLQRILSDPLEKLYTFTVSASVLQELGKVLGQYMKDYVDARFHSLKMLDCM